MGLLLDQQGLTVSTASARYAKSFFCIEAIDKFTIVSLIGRLGSARDVIAQNPFNLLDAV
jgi:hypothetical protein